MAKKMTFRLIILSISILQFVGYTLASNGWNNDTTGINSRKKVKNIILLIGDGMGTTQISAGIAVNGNLNIEKFKYIGFSKTQSASNYVTDSGAGGTAISTGHRTKNKYIAKDTSGNNLKTILEIAEENGLATGLVSTSAITHATPASFIAHNTNRNKYQELALDFLKTDIDVFIGGGKKDFNEREDKKDLINELKLKGYQITDTITDLEKIKTGKLAGFTANGHNPSILDGRGDMLSIATNKAIELLNQNHKGFFLMVEGSQIDWAGHDNNAEQLIQEVLDFDKAVGIALDFAKKDGKTLVIVTADHETGGMALNGWDLTAGKPIVEFTSKDHTGVMVPVFAYGPGAEEFLGIYKNTELFYKMLRSYGIHINL